MKSAAPAPVHYRLAQGGGLFLLAAAALLLLGGALLAWLLALRQAGHSGVFIWLATAAAYGFASLLTWRSVQGLPAGWLVWNGTVWSVQPHHESLQAEQGRGVQAAASYLDCTLVLDMQQAVLLRLHGCASGMAQGGWCRRACWVWASRASDVQRWHALRCALVWAHARDAVLDAANGTTGTTRTIRTIRTTGAVRHAASAADEGRAASVSPSGGQREGA